MPAAKFLNCSLLVALAATVLAAQCSEGSIEDKAWTLIREGRQDIALTMLNQALRHQKKASLYSTRGCCYEQMGKFDQAIADLDEAQKLDSKDVNVKVHRSYCFMRTKQWKKAIADLDVMIASGDDSGYINRALAYEQLGDHSYSIKDKQKIQVAKMRTALRQAERLDSKSEFREAEKKYAEAIASNPTSKVGYMCLGRMHLHRNQHEQALADFSKAITVCGGTDAWAYAERGQTYLMLNRYDESIADCSMAIKLGETEAYGIRSKDYFALGDTKHCLDDLTTAISIMSKKPLEPSTLPLEARVQSMGSHDFLTACYKERAQIYAQLKQPKQAMSDYAKASELDPLAFRPTWEQAQYLDKVGEIEAATKAYTILIGRFPKMSEPYRRRADNLLKTGQPDKAVPDYTKAIELMDIDAGPSYFGRAQAYDKLGKPDLAKKDRATAKQLGFGK